MTLARLIALLLLAAGLGLSACGVKGDPIRPGSEDDPKKQTSE